MASLVSTRTYAVDGAASTVQSRPMYPTGQSVKGQHVEDEEIAHVMGEPTRLDVPNSSRNSLDSKAEYSITLPQALQIAAAGLQDCRYLWW